MNIESIQEEFCISSKAIKESLLAEIKSRWHEIQKIMQQTDAFLKLLLKLLSTHM